MALNDFVLIDGILDDIIDREGKSKTDNKLRGSVFERFAISELLKTYDLTTDQIENGMMDGGDDGGLDGLFIFVNGNYLSDTSNYQLPRENGKLEIYIITCKHHNKYEINPLESLDSSLSELLNFTIKDEDLSRKYNSKVLKKRSLLYNTYRKLASQNIAPVINIFYISRGNASSVPENIQRTGEKIKATCSSIFQGAKISMTFWGAEQLIARTREQRNTPIEMSVQRSFQCGHDYVVLVNLDDYIKSVTDKEGKLKRYLFNENVRDYLGENHTNSDIMNTLLNEQSPDFWLLNNGVTMLTSGANLFDNIMTIHDVQIVNGLQTTVTIFNYYQNGHTDPYNRKVLIKVINPSSSAIGKEITKATNNQSTIPLYALHANDKIQRDIEDILFRNDFYYERRPMYYQNLGYPREKIVLPLYLASGYTALILKLPHRATLLRSRFMDNNDLCDKVFSESTDINLWPVIATILKRTDATTEKYRSIVKKSTEKYLRSVRYIVSLVTVARIIGKFSFGSNDLVKMDLSCYSEDIIVETIRSLIDFINDSDLKTVTKMNNRNVANSYLNTAAQQFSLSDFSAISQRPDITTHQNVSTCKLTGEFLDMVKAELPEQPWPVGIHKIVASKLNCSNAKVWKAMEELIRTGAVYKQKDGILYDCNGQIVVKRELSLKE